MDDHLTYKVEELYGSDLNQLCFSIAINDVSVSFEVLSKNLAKFFDEMANSIHEMMQNLNELFDSSFDSSSDQDFTNSSKRLIPIKCVRPTHKAPVYKIIPKVRNRC